MIGYDPACVLTKGLWIAHQAQPFSLELFSGSGGTWQNSGRVLAVHCKARLSHLQPKLATSSQSDTEIQFRLFPCRYGN